MSSTIALQELLKAGFDDFIVPVYETAPFTTIQNRAQVTRSLKAIAGVERVMVRGINRLQNEFGPNGEQVFEADNKDARIRFVGSGWNELSNTYGAYVQSTTTNDSLEITFYGTGLNILVSAAASAVDVRPTVDNQVEGSDIFPVVISTVIGGRNYAPNIVIPVVKDLSLGLHTVKLRIASSGLEFVPNGFEVLNQRTDLAVYSGAGISEGSFNGLSSLSTSSFTEGVTGTRGARVVKYIQDGVIKSAVQVVNASAAYLTSADHTNEEVVRRINFREFGANRADDFSTLAGTSSSRAFTLDDGITTLAASNAKVGVLASETLSLNGNLGNIITLTFVGTGIDLVITTDSTTRAGDIFIDSISIGSISKTGSSGIETRKVCSGLPYGTHTLRIYQPSNLQDTFAVSDFIIYQPKKPSIPAGALEIVDYNDLAEYSNPASTVAGSVPSGVIRKMNMREFTYSGTWAASLLVASPSGFLATTSTAASYVEYRFWGTGFNYRFGNNAAAQSFTVSVNGSTNLSTLTTALSATAGLAFTAATGIVTGTPAASINENNLSVTGLTLGLHVVRVTWTSGAVIIPEAFDIVTPIHINNPTLKVGSQSVKSVVKYSPEKVQPVSGPDLSKAKVLLVYNSSSQTILSSVNVSSVLKLNTGIIRVFFEKPFKNNSYIGVAVGTTYDCTVTLSNTGVDNRKSNSIDLENFLSDTNTWLETTFSIACFGELIDE